MVRREGRGYKQKETGMAWYENLLSVREHDGRIQDLKRTENFADCVSAFDPI